MEEDVLLLRFLHLEKKVEDLYLINAYFLMRQLENVTWKIDAKTLLLPFVFLEKSSIADVLEKWSFFRDSDDISSRLPPLIKFNIIREDTGPGDILHLSTTQKGWFVVSFFFYVFVFDNNKALPQFDFFDKNAISLPGFDTPDNFFRSLKILKSKCLDFAKHIQLIQEKIMKLRWKIDYKVLMVPLYLLDDDDQCYMDLIQNYPQFGYYKQLKQRISPLITIGILEEEKSGRKGTMIRVTKKGRYFLSFLGYMLGFPNFPSMEP
ncbi:MAG: hypothetical protein ACTSUE_12100 [Promethearchaeota archaeon]